MSDTENVLLAAVNSQFIHSNTAVYYLYQILIQNNIEADVKSFSINDDKHDILSEILESKPKVVCFSCYIWNISYVYDLCKALRRIDKKIKIILGGPEVTYEPAEAFIQSGADLLVLGEGESVIVSAVLAMLNDEWPTCPGCYYESEGTIINTGIAVTDELGKIPSPFTDFMMEKERNKLIYYEASRGCPFNCIYCLSSATTGVRYFPLERIFSDLNTILRYSLKVVKFTDRSFNANQVRTLEILDFLKNVKTETCFHLEIFPAGLTDKVTETLAIMPKGRVQLEAGIQSVNPITLEASGRIQDAIKAISNMKKLTGNENMHIHLDLIAGLPFEGLESFENSFNKTIDAKPHVLQVGFLKLLKGTTARNIEGYEYEDSPPYEVLVTPWLTFIELSEIKQIEKLIDLFYNTGRFRTYLAYMHEKAGNPYHVYKELALYLNENNFSLKGISKKNKYAALAGFADKDSIAIEHLRYDYMTSYSSKDIPEFLGETFSKEMVFEHLKNDAIVREVFAEQEITSPKKLYKMCNVSRFNYGKESVVFFFNYSCRDKVTDLYSAIPIQI